jgi:multicomponent Na+:H+ antiporter subunit A
MLYLAYGAPDLALTQIAVDALSCVLLVLAFHRLPEFRIRSAVRSRLMDATFALLCGAIMTLLVLKVGSTPISRELSDFFTTRSYTEAHGRNVVNVILVDFRALDTLGEITVLAIAALGVGAITLRRAERADRESAKSAGVGIEEPA